MLPGPETSVADREQHLSILIESQDRSGTRQKVDDSEWMSGLVEYLTHLVDLRVAHVEEWLKSNTQRFQADNASMEELCQAYKCAVIDLRASVQVCKSECDECNLLCIQSRFHEGAHNCLTSHDCIHDCTFCDKQMIMEKTCGQMYVSSIQLSIYHPNLTLLPVRVIREIMCELLIVRQSGFNIYLIYRTLAAM